MSLDRTNIYSKSYYALVLEGVESLIKDISMMEEPIIL